MRTLGFRPNDAIFSADVTRLFADVGGSILVYSTATGSLLTTYETGGQSLLGLDISPDGTTLVAADSRYDVLAASGSTTQVAVRFYQVDLPGGTITTRQATLVNGAGFYDIALLSNNSAVLTRSSVPASRVPLVTVNLQTGSFTEGAVFPTALLSVGSDHSGLLAGTIGYSSERLATLDAQGAITASATLDHLNYDGIQAISTTADRIIEGSNGALQLFDGRLNFIADLAPTLSAQMERGSLSAVAFSPDGTRLYGVNPATSLIYEFATSDWRLLRTWATGTVTDPASLGGYSAGFGNELAVSRDGHYLSVIGATLQLVDLLQDGRVQGTNGDDRLDGTGATEAIYGFAGNDRLVGLGGDTLIGGDGDDTYIVDDTRTVVIERAGAGYDTVITSVALTAPDQTEALVLTPGAVATITANPSGTRLVGNELGTALDGSSGNDVILGGRGNDIISGGGGSDTAIIAAPLAGSSLTIDRIFYYRTFFNESVTVTSVDGVDVLRGIQMIRFDDGTIYTANAFAIDAAVGAFLHRHATATELAVVSATIPTAVSEEAVRAATVAALHLRPPVNDFNGDGRSDILWHNDDGRVTNWLGRPDLIGSFFQNDAAALRTVPAEWRIVGTGDFNGDGKVDLLWRGDDGRVTDWLGNAAGGYAINDANALASVATSWRVVGTGDFNGDGRADILWRNADGRVTDWLGTASGGFVDNGAAVASSAAGGAAPAGWHVAGTGDFNGDGRDDILWRNDDGQLTDWLSNAQGGFSSNDGNALARVATSWHVVGTGDFNGDGRADILWRNDSGLTTDWLGTASGGFTENFANFLQTVATSWTVAATGDYDGDGRSDILWRNDDGRLSDWLGTAGGGFTDNGSLAQRQVPNDWHVVAAARPDVAMVQTVAFAVDFNGDKRDDILWRNADGRLTDWLGTASGGFADNSANGARSVSTDWHIVGTGDFNGDGRGDILWRNDDGRLTDWLGQAGGGYTTNDANAATVLTTAWQVVATGDINGDGRTDIVWRNADGRLTDWLGTASGGFTSNDANALRTISNDWHIVATGDINGDGKADLVWRNDDGRLTDWLGNAAGGYASNDANALRTISTDWHIVGTGDFNGDGKADLLWRNDNGAMTDWLGNAAGGYASNDANAFAQVPNLWQMVAIGDFNGDGRDDIAWRNEGGALTDWLGQANGGFVSNDANALNQVPTSWHVAPYTTLI